MKRKVLAGLLSLCMIFSLLPTAAFAAEDGENVEPQVDQPVAEQPEETNTPAEGDNGSDNEEAEDPGQQEGGEGEEPTQPKGPTVTVLDTKSIEYKERSAYINYQDEPSTLEKSSGRFLVTLYYTIEEGAPDDLVFDMSNEIADIFKAYPMPGAIIEVKVVIKNNSNKEYEYVDNSFVIAPMQMPDNEDALYLERTEDGNLRSVLTYDGQNLPIWAVGSMVPSMFKDAFDKTPSFDELCQVYSVLEEKGYTGSDAISKYLLDQYDKEHAYGSLSDFISNNPKWWGNQSFNGIYTMTQDDLAAYVKKYPNMEKYFYATQKKNSDKLNVQIKWPEREIAVATFNSYYNDLFAAYYGSEAVEKIDTTSGGSQDIYAHGIGDYRKKTEERYKEADSYFHSLFEHGMKSGDTITIDYGLALDGPGVGNMYQNYGFGYYSAIELTKKPPVEWNVNRTKSATQISKSTWTSDVTLDIAAAEGETLGANSIVVDTIGDNFNFVEDAANLKVTVGDTTYTATKEEPAAEEGAPEATATYHFKTDGAGEDAVDVFVLEYYKDGATAEQTGHGVVDKECFVWKLCQNVPENAHAKLTYTVRLENPQSASGTYGVTDLDGNGQIDNSTTSYTDEQALYTNEIAVLYPVDGTGYDNYKPLEFPKPSVSYSNSGGGGGRPSNPPVVIPDDPTPLGPTPNLLNTKDHYGYIIGYPVNYFTGEPTDDQTKKPVRPEGDITRAEVATIFFRMLTDESRTTYWSQDSGYSDVAKTAWYNNAISTLSKTGVIKGYPDGTFQPNGKITRAEFATIATRFFEIQYDGPDFFSDVAGHWAQDYINQAASANLVNGYPDGTFGPQKNITRAEAVTLVNRVLQRYPDKEELQKDMLVWPDNMDITKWYYADMQEATNSHDYQRTTDGKTETWTKLQPIRDWEAFEKEWSDANSSANPGEVVNP